MSFTTSDIDKHFVPTPNLWCYNLTGPTFMAWSMYFMIFLNSHDLIGYVDGNKRFPNKLFGIHLIHMQHVFGKTIVLKVGSVLPFLSRWLLFFMGLRQPSRPEIYLLEFECDPNSLMKILVEF